MYAVVNPGEGVNATIDGYATYLASLGQAFGVPGRSFSDTLISARVRVRHLPELARQPQGHPQLRRFGTPADRGSDAGLSGMFSYSYSSLWGNYTGLTTTDQSDGGVTGRNSPDTTRAFDEPFYYFGANGKSTNGPLPTDRPNVIKGYVYYTLPGGSTRSPTSALFQNFLQGTPLGSYY